MTGLQRGAYRFQSLCLVFLVVAFLCLILDWLPVSVFLQIVAMGCLIKAMMYRERWEVDYRNEMYMRWIHNEERKLD